MGILEILSYLTLLLTFSMLVYFLGHITLSFFNIKANKRVLFLARIMLGLLILVFGYALLKSKGSTYLLVLIPLAAFLLGKTAKHFTIQNIFRRILSFELFTLFSFLGTGIIIFLITCTQVISVDLSRFFLHPDFGYYTCISEILMSTGIESINVDLALSGIAHYSFYHYFELWVNAMFMETTGLPGTSLLTLVVFPFFASIAVFGFFLWMRATSQRTANRFVLYMLSYSIILIAPLIKSFRWALGLAAGKAPWNLSILSIISVKSVVVLSGLVFTFMLYKHKRELFPLGLLILGIIYPPTLIVLIPSLFIWLPFLSYIKGKTGYKQYFVLLGMFLFVYLIVLFLNKNELVQSIPLTNLTWEYFSSDWSRLMILIKEPIMRTVWIGLTFFPLILILFLLNKKTKYFNIGNHFEMVLFFIICYALGVLGVPLLEFTLNGDQLLRNLFDPLLILGTVAVLGTGIVKETSALIKTLSVFCLSLLLFFSLPSLRSHREILNHEMHEQIVELITPHLEGVGYIKSEKQHKNVWNNNIFFEIPYPNLRNYTRGYFPHCLSLDKIPIQSVTDRAYSLKNMLNARFYKDQIEDRKTPMEIIAENNITAVFIHKEADENTTFTADTGFIKYSFMPYDLFIKKDIPR